jgi:opacity protein-like surface antigen
VKRLVIAAALLVLAPAAAQAADLSGVWKVHGVFTGVISYTAVCTFRQSGASFAGPCVDPSNKTNVQAKGAVSGGAVEFGYDASFNGLAVHLDYKGALQADGSLKGVIATGGPQGAFTANR